MSLSWENQHGAVEHRTSLTYDLPLQINPNHFLCLVQLQLWTRYSLLSIFLTDSSFGRKAGATDIADYKISETAVAVDDRNEDYNVSEADDNIEDDNVSETAAIDDNVEEDDKVSEAAAIDDEDNVVVDTATVADNHNHHQVNIIQYISSPIFYCNISLFNHHPCGIFCNKQMEHCLLICVDRGYLILMVVQLGML